MHHLHIRHAHFPSTVTVEPFANTPETSPDTSPLTVNIMLLIPFPLESYIAETLTVE